MMIKQSLFSESFFMVISLFLFSTITTTILAQSPAAAPGLSVPVPTSPQPPAQAPAMVTVPVVPVSPTIAAPSPAEAPTTPSVDIIKILKKAKRFSVLIRLLKTTQLINQLNSQLLTTNDGGVTIFAPDDSAFSKLKSGFLNSLSDQQKVELLQFHILSSVISLSNFDTLTNPVRTQAGDNPSRLGLNVTAYGDQVSMTTGVVTTKISGTVYTDNKLAIYQVDKVLLPLDFFAPKPRAPAPSPSKSVAEAPGKADKEKSSDENNSTDTDTNAVSVDKSASVSSKMHGVWHFLLLVIALCAVGSI